MPKPQSTVNMLLKNESVSVVTRTIPGMAGVNMGFSIFS